MAMPADAAKLLLICDGAHTGLVSTCHVYWRAAIKKKGTMATKELRELLHKYKVAYTTYMHCVHALGVTRPRVHARHERCTLVTVMRSSGQSR